jgi:hypothetical protein
MVIPDNALILNGKVIAILEESSAASLIELADGGNQPGMQYCGLEIPLRRNDDTIDRQPINHRADAETPVSKREVKLTIEFTRRGETKFVVDR